MPLTITLSDACAAELRVALGAGTPTSPPPNPVGGGDTTTQPAVLPRFIDGHAVVAVTRGWGEGFTTQEFGSFVRDAIVVQPFTVPADYRAAGQTRISFAEYGGPPTFRTVTISRTPGDFRALDSTGVNGPLASIRSGIGNIAMSIAGGLGAAKVVPGQTYYLNISNRSGSICTCTGTCDLIVVWTVAQ